MQTMQRQSAMISNKRTGKSVSVDFTYSPPKPAAAGHQHYVYCISGTNMPVVYFSEVFAATTTSDRVGPSPAPNRYTEIADPFKAFLDKKYGVQSNAATPPTCRVTDPNPAGLQAAQKAKQGYEDMYKQQYKKEIVETGWKEQ
jgi:hypothetical protein